MKRLLFIAHRVPYPPDKGERTRAFHEIKALADHFRVTVAALCHTPADEQSAAALGPWCEKIITARGVGFAGRLRSAASVLCGRSATEGFFHSKRLERLLAEEARREPFDLVLAYCSSMFPVAMTVPAKARVTDLVDADSAKWADYAQTASRVNRWLYRRESRAVAALETRAIRDCEAVVVVSAAEAKALPCQSPKVIPVGNGVDTEFFQPAGPDATQAEASLVFTGSMDYRPNVEGVCWFVREVWPRLRRQVPSATFTVVGRDPAPAVRQLAKTPGVAVTGSVPDVRPYLAAASVVVCPLHIARGIQNKILEAMAAGRAVVASAAAIEGLDVEVGRDLLRADTPEEWAGQIGRLVGSLDERRRLEQSARRCVAENYSWPARMAPLVALCRRLVGEEGPDHAPVGAGPFRQSHRANAEAGESCGR